MIRSRHRPKCTQPHPDGMPADVVLGTQFCWQCERQRVGEFVARDGQLVWQTLGTVSPPVVIAFAVTVGQDEVVVLSVDAPRSTFLPIHLEGGGQAVVDLDQLIGHAYDGDAPREVLDAKRH